MLHHVKSHICKHNAKILNNGQTNPNDKPKKVYTSVDQYQPTGKLVYNPDLFEKIEKKVL